MGQHFLKLAFRNIKKHQLFSIINILGLAVGIACTLLSGAYVWQEWSVNKNLRNPDQQYVIQSKWQQPNMGIELTSLGNLAKSLKETYPNLIANYYRWDGITTNVSKDDKIFREGLQVGDSTLLEMYGFPLVYGEESTALDAPFSLVITTEKANKYFGKTDVIGETLNLENFSGERRDFKITGVLDKSSKNSVTFVRSNNDNHFFIPTNTLSFFNRSIDTWTNPFVLSYIELQNGVSSSELEQPMKDLLAQHTPPSIHENLSPYVVPLTDFYLEDNQGLVKKMIYAFSAIALFILLMAVINFVNIAIAKADGRLREIGVRKVLGGRRKELMIQFQAEALLLVAGAALVAWLLYYFARPFFSSFIGIELVSLFDYPVYFALATLILSVLIALLAGTYPALMLSSAPVVHALTARFSSVRRNIWSRKLLVTFQFFTAAVVLICAIVIAQQVNYFFSDNLGYDKDYLLSVPTPRDWSSEGTEKMQTLRHQFDDLPEVLEASLTYQLPNGNNPGQMALYQQDTEASSAIASQMLVADEFYATTFGIEMAAGDFFGIDRNGQDSAGVVINESLSKALGWKNVADAIGQQVRIPDNPASFSIRGVVVDYHYGSMKDNIEPAVFLHVSNTNYYRYLCFKIQAGNVQAALQALQNKWATLLPNAPFDYTFMDETLQTLYDTELRLKKAVQAATFLAILIVLLGVFGLVAIAIQKRTKEIGIRKVIGAAPSQIVMLFLKDFLGIILIAGVLAWPVAWCLMQGWLSDYQYPIALTPFPFLLTLLLLLLLAVCLIGFQCLQATRLPPADAIRRE